MVSTKTRFDSRVTTVLAAAAIIGLVGAGAGFAAGTIGSADIVDDSLRSKDIKDESIKLKDIKDAAEAKLKGQTGPAGPQGPSGSGEVRITSMPVVPSVSGAPTTYAANTWRASNNTVALTADGVKYGPYADGGAAGGSACTNVLAGQPFSAIKSLAYQARYTATNDTGGVGVPYLRVFFTNVTSGAVNRAIFSPNTQSPDGFFPEGQLVEYVGTQGSWRYNDDGGDNPDSSFATVQAANASQVISEICVSDGFNAGTNLTGLLRWLEVNGTTYRLRGN